MPPSRPDSASRRCPGYAWGLFARPQYDTSWFMDETLSWNLRVDSDRSYRIWPDGRHWIDAELGLRLSQPNIR